MPDVRATIRLQFHRDFTFRDAIPLVAYFSQLGISHIYASPLLKARAGSTHGYDVVDPTLVNPELGGEAALRDLVAELRNHGMGLIADMVSNHMAVGNNDNPWWQDVLTWGLGSPYAHFFDIEWDSPDPLLEGQLLLPFLGTHYGEVLAAGELRLEADQNQGAFYVSYYDHHFPLCPTTYDAILQLTDDAQLQTLGNAFAALKQDDQAWAKAPGLQQQLRHIAQQPAVQHALAEALANFKVTLSDQAIPSTQDIPSTQSIPSTQTTPGPSTDDSLQRLHQLLERQHYRLASWRTAADDINWRRFFDVNELGGLRVERQEVFEALHRKIFALIGAGIVDGLRIDHIDGLANPRTYCRKLRRRLDRLSTERPPGLQEHIPIYVEKILAEGECLPSDWQVDGTTGYEFMNQVSLLQHDPKGAFQLYDLWSRFSGREGSFEDEVKEARRLVLSSSLAGDVETVAQGLTAIARQDIATRDLTLGALRRALIELVVHFPVYRTYVSACGRTRPQDNEFFNRALTGARTTLAEADWPLLDYLETWLGGEALHSLPPGHLRQLRQKVLTRFQQLTSPTAAKAVEDTACYRSAVLLSRNDVGFDPQQFSMTPAQFHARNSERAAQFPHNLLSTATHDHKRGEDTRARIAVLSERPVWFTGKVEHWHSLAQPLRSNLDEGPAPTPGDELLLYQTLLGCWPLDLTPESAQADWDNFLERLLLWQEKALREAKLRTSWTAPNTDYENACRTFLTRLLQDPDLAALRTDLCAAAHSLAPAGALNSLSQTLVRMCSPGIPDLYQGADFWDFSLVDPDNRRPVDFATRQAALCSAPDSPEPAEGRELLHNWRDGRIKQWLIHRTLVARQKYPALFAQGDYLPLDIVGEQADHALAFMRHYQGHYALVVVARLGVSLLADNTVPTPAAGAWGDTHIVLPEVCHTRRFNSELDAHPLTHDQGIIHVADILADFPVGLAFAEPVTINNPRAPLDRASQGDEPTSPANVPAVAAPMPTTA